MTSMDSLFEQGRQQHARAQAPLPERMRPRNFDEFVGQEHILGSERMLRRAIAADRLPSLILWGRRAAAKPPWRA